MEAALNTPSGRMPLGIAIIKIGSAQDNQLILNDPQASPLHAGIRPEEHGYSITDLGSASGTFVNGQRLDYNTPRLLSPGDTIRIGDTFFAYEMNSAPLAAASFPGNTGQITSSGYSPTVAAGSPLSSSSYAQSIPSGAYQYQSSSFSSTYVAPPTGPAAQPQPPLTVASLLHQEHRRDLWIAVGIFAAVLLVGFIIFSNLHSPQRALDAYCSSLQSGDYQTAYNQLAPGQQQAFASESDFAVSESRDRTFSCTYNNVSVSGNSATASIMFTTSSGTFNNVIVLVQDSGFNWRIDSFKR